MAEADAGSATNGVAGVRTSWTVTMMAMPLGDPNLARVAASAAFAAHDGAACRHLPRGAWQPRSTARHEACQRRPKTDPLATGEN
jgi:hypothetical protein